MMCLLAAALVVRHRLGEARGPAVLAVGAVREYGGTDSSGIVRALSEMLSTNIARIPALRLTNRGLVDALTFELVEPIVTVS